jgi:flagellar biosynthesis chaperone FliJ
MKLATRSPEQKQEEMRAILVEKKAERTAKQVLMDSVMRKYSPNEAAMERAYAANHATRSVRSRKF